MATWAFRFLLFYIVVLCVQPQNRFLFLHPMRLGNLTIITAAVLHFVSASQAGKPLIRFGPATITALLLMLFSFISLHTGVFQTATHWNSDIDLIYKNCFVLILVDAMAWNVQRVWAVQATLLLATTWWLKGGIRLATAGATYSGDRIMGPAVSLIENPNGFAYLMTVMIPLYLYFFQKAHNKYVRWGNLGAALAAVFIVMQTGSRTGVLALAAVGVFLLPKYGAKYKRALIIGGVAIFMLMSTVGASNIERFKTIPASIKSFLGGVDEDADVASMNQDQQSAWERKMKNRHTWQLILDFPLFGVGIQSNHALVAERYPFAAGQVHNEILYAGKQMGFIGIGLYIAFMTILFRSGRRVENETRPWWPEVSDLGWTFKMQAIVFMVGGFFSPIPWNPIYLVLVASASSLLLHTREIARTQPQLLSSVRMA
ncbi:MAG TPA: O-antigen ligase family protein [Kiritimatiellia bacterium]|nr:O-antigen ligase family protein [Kiritimatiellia bacterium]